MRYRHLVVLTTLSCSLAVGGETQSNAPDRQPATLTNGLNYIDFTGDNVNDLVVVGHRENFNAHSFEVVTFFTNETVVRDKPKTWQIVPMFRGDGKELLQIMVSGGADCVLRDFRLLPRSRTLILAERDLGSSFADTGLVTFTTFRLAENKDAEPGRPVFSFEEDVTIRSDHKYCDVGDAFQGELGIPQA